MGLLEQPAGPLDGGLQLLHDRRQPTGGPAATGQGPAGVGHDPAGVGQLGLGQPGDLPGDLEHDLLGVTSARPHGPGDLLGAAPGGPSTVPDPGAGGTPGRLDPLGRGGQLVDRAGHQPQVGRVGHLGGDHGGVGAELVGAQQLALGRPGQQRLVQPLHGLLAHPAGELDQGGRMGTRPPRGMRQNRCQEIESATSRHSSSSPSP